MNDIVITMTAVMFLLMLFAAALSLWEHSLTEALAFLAGAVVVAGLLFNIYALRDLAFGDGQNTLLSNQDAWVYYSPFLVAIGLFAISVFLNFVGWPRAQVSSEQKD